jgi:hypothetical protein
MLGMITRKGQKKSAARAALFHQTKDKQCGGLAKLTEFRSSKFETWRIFLLGIW